MFELWLLVKAGIEIMGGVLVMLAVIYGFSDRLVSHLQML